MRKLGRVMKDKIAGDIERVFKGTSKTREKLGVILNFNFKFKELKVIDELMAYWTLESSEDTLQDLEDALIVNFNY